MIIVGGINMITALLITILEKKNSLCIKSFRATPECKKNIFDKWSIFDNKGFSYWKSNIFYSLFLQHQFNIIELDPTVYYVNSVPVDLNFINIILLNTSRS